MVGQSHICLDSGADALYRGTGRFFTFGLLESSLRSQLGTGVLLRKYDHQILPSHIPEHRTASE